MQQVLSRALDIKHTKVKDLKPHPKNPNKHSNDQIDRLAEIIRYQGFRNPVIVSKLSGFVVAGHGRIEAAKKLGMETVPVTFQDFDDENQEYAAIVADNAIAQWAHLEFGQINVDLPELGPDFDIDFLGIKDFQIDVADNFDEPDEKKSADDKEAGLKACPNCGVLIDG